MIVTRFCSRQEYDRLISGETLTNTADHYRGGSGGSTSRGFCFTPDKPEAAWRYLKGIVSCDVCLTLDFPDGFLKKSSGIYASHAPGGPARRIAREYCATSYSLAQARLVKAVPVEAIAPAEEVAAARFMLTIKSLLQP